MTSRNEIGPVGAAPAALTGLPAASIGSSPGLLAIRDWTTYELARQMERGVGDIWAAARSMVYEEPKRLADLGLVHARTEAVGRRRRTRYGITPQGLTVLRSWLAEPGAPPAMQFEGLLKILLADATQQDAVDASLAEAIKWADEPQDTGRLVAAEYAAGQGPFQEWAHLVALSFAFLSDYAEFVRRWASWAQQEAGRWPGGESRSDVFHRALSGGSPAAGSSVSHRWRGSAGERIAMTQPPEGIRAQCARQQMGAFAGLRVAFRL